MLLLRLHLLDIDPLPGYFSMGHFAYSNTSPLLWHPYFEHFIYIFSFIARAYKRVPPSLLALTIPPPFRFFFMSHTSQANASYIQLAPRHPLPFGSHFSLSAAAIPISFRSVSLSIYHLLPGSHAFSAPMLLSIDLFFDMLLSHPPPRRRQERRRSFPRAS